MRCMGSLVFATVVLNLAFAGSADNPHTGKFLYFLKDDLSQQWCAYAGETEFKTQVKDRAAFVLGGADYADGHLVAVHLTQADDTGDWVVKDDYTFDKDGNIESLKRTINIVPEDTSEEQRFIIKNGKVLPQSHVLRKLHLGKASQKSVTGFDAPRIITIAADFPFSEFLGSKRDEVWSKGSVCVP